METVRFQNGYGDGVRGGGSLGEDDGGVAGDTVRDGKGDLVEAKRARFYKAL
jgi:hypothetical protein